MLWLKALSVITGLQSVLHVGQTKCSNIIFTLPLRRVLSLFTTEYINPVSILKSIPFPVTYNIEASQGELDKRPIRPKICTAVVSTRDRFVVKEAGSLMDGLMGVMMYIPRSVNKLTTVIFTHH